MSSRSHDVECKSLSYWQAGREGPVVDSIADYHVGCLLSMQVGKG